jgi:hypothetical protein
MHPTPASLSFLFSRSFLCAAVLLLQIFCANAQSDAPIVIPQPQPAAVVPPQDPHPIIPFVAAPDPQQIKRCKPAVSVSRNGSDVPQMPKRFGERSEWILVPASQPVNINLQFDRSLAGTAIGVLADTGVTLAPPDSVRINGAGKAVFVVMLDASVERGQVLLDVNGVPTALRFRQAPLWAVEKKEQAIAGGGR